MRLLINSEHEAERAQMNTAGLPAGWTHVVDIMRANRPALCIFLDGNGEVRAQEEGAAWPT